MKVERTKTERVATWASAICAVHCALTGLALGLMSVAGLGFMDSPAVEVIFLGTAVTIGSFALYHGHKRHKSMIPAAIFVAGLACIAASHFAFDHGDTGGVAMAVLGGSALVAFNLVNQRLGGHCGCDDCRTGKH
jgi:threonine/homoserine efflux transporter RhtA